MQRREIDSFNAMRGLAAVAVTVNHLRGFLFIPYPQVAHPGVLGGAFYFLTGLGHEAVMIFFVMSGWLVGGSMWAQKEFSWSRYAITRLSRLLVVLIPALIVTYAVDTLGLWLSGGFGYDGSMHGEIASAPKVMVSLSPLTALGNLAFLQTIAVPVYGSDNPLWSLANEFWYYVIFPLLVLAWRLRGMQSAVHAVVGLCILVLLPQAMASYFAIWLLGWAASTCWQRIPWPALSSALSGGLVCTALWLSRKYHGPLLELGLGAAVALLMASLRGLPNFNWASRFWSRLAGMSYSLYVVHFPVLALLFFSTRHHPQQPGALVYAEFLVVLCAVLVFATLFWHLFERRTPEIRRLFAAFARGTYALRGRGQGQRQL